MKTLKSCLRYRSFCIHLLSRSRSRPPTYLNMLQYRVAREALELAGVNYSTYTTIRCEPTDGSFQVGVDLVCGSFVCGEPRARGHCSHFAELHTHTHTHTIRGLLRKLSTLRVLATTTRMLRLVVALLLTL